MKNKELIHYVIVRRDLPFGTTLAMVGHAAADSAEKWARSWFRYKRGHDPITLVVLGVPNKESLIKARFHLFKNDVRHVPVRDAYPSGHYQLLALGAEPGPREDLSSVFARYELYKEFEGPQDLVR